MQNFLMLILVLIDLMFIIIFIHIVLSWMQILWVKIKIKFIDSILEPIYKKIKNIIPTTIWPFELAPAIVIVILLFVQIFIANYDPVLFTNYKNLINF